MTPAAVHPGHVLPVGTRLRDYEITGLIGEGGFGIVYLAWDHSLQRKVAVKEYMPASMASRVAGSSAIVVKSARHADTFRAALKSFVNEARLLARFDHPSLVKVYRFWEENGTAYMVMPFYEGPTLKTALAELGHVPSEAELRAWLKPLLDALAVMHAAQCYHRDIAPDNILLTPTGPLLLDFGAARRVIGDMTHALTVVLKPGYAPIEQYGDVATMAQGAWTDLYALACVVYYAITGTTPMSSVERLMDDRLAPLAVTAAGRYSPAFLAAIDHALAVRPHDRPQNERQFRERLDADTPVTIVRPPAVVPRPAPPPFPRTEESAWGSLASGPAATPEPTQVQSRTRPPRTDPPQATVPQRPPVPPLPVRPLPAAAPAPLAAARPAASPGESQAPRPAARPRTPAAAPVAATRPRRWPWTAGLALAALVVVVGVLALLRQFGPAGAAVPTTVPASAAAAVAPAVTAAPSAGGDAAPPSSRPPEPTPVPEPPVATPTEVPTLVKPPTPVGPSTRDPVRREPRAEPVRRAEPAPVAKPPPRANGPRCSDILQKASLEPLTADEAAYLKRECR